MSCRPRILASSNSGTRWWWSSPPATPSGTWWSTRSRPRSTTCASRLGRLWARNGPPGTRVARRLRELGDGEQNRRVFECVQRVPRLGNDQEVAVTSLPLGGVGNEPYPSPQNLDGRLAGILVLRQRRPGGQRDERLPQHMLMTTVDRLGGAAGRSGRCRLHQDAGTRLERELLHVASVVTRQLDRQSCVRSVLAATCEAASYAA